MELSIEVREANIVTKNGIGKKTGKPYSIHQQAAMVSLPNGETRRVVLQHDDGDAALSPGSYRPKASAYWVGDFGSLSISNRAKHWERVETKAAQKAA